jgi:hypothetical protein
MIYVIVDETETCCKIGYSANPKKRCQDIQTSIPFNVELVIAVDGTIQDEKQVHRRFDHLRMKGEWFEYEDTIVKYLLPNGAYWNEREARLDVIREIRTCDSQEEIDVLWKTYIPAGMKEEEIDYSELKSQLTAEAFRLGREYTTEESLTDPEVEQMHREYIDSKQNI